MDAFGVATERDETSPFVELLWEQGLVHENAIAETLPITANMKLIGLADRERETLRAMARCEPLIYGGRLTAGDLVGEPDLLEWAGIGYIPGDIKSGSGFEGDEGEGRFKKHYAFQLAHYVFILEQLGSTAPGRSAYIVDRDGRRVVYPLMEPQGIRNTATWWDSYLEALTEIRAILAQTKKSRPALSSACALCHWQSSCKEVLEEAGAVCSAGEVEALFAHPSMIDLYFDVIKKATEWPLYNQSIKAIAKYLGFQWRDATPSGAASIEWYNRWIETGDPAIKQRILDYNEDDCLATGVVVDGIRALPVMT
jgi:predicted RecB family nuclease